MAIYVLARCFVPWTVPIVGARTKTVAIGFSYYEDNGGIANPNKDILAARLNGQLSGLAETIMGSDLTGGQIRIWYPTVSGDTFSDTTVTVESGSAGSSRLPLDIAATVSLYTARRGVPHPGRIQIPGIITDAVNGDLITPTYLSFLRSYMNTFRTFNVSSGGVIYHWHWCVTSLTHSPRPFDVSTVICPPVSTYAVPESVGIMTHRRVREPTIRCQCCDRTLPATVYVTFSASSCPALAGRTYECTWIGGGTWSSGHVAAAVTHPPITVYFACAPFSHACFSCEVIDIVGGTIAYQSGRDADSITPFLVSFPSMGPSYTGGGCDTADSAATVTT